MGVDRYLIETAYALSSADTIQANKELFLRTAQPIAWLMCRGE